VRVEYPKACSSDERKTCEGRRARTHEELRREFAQRMLAELHYQDSSRLIAVFVLVFLAAPDVILAAELPVVIGVAATASATASGTESERFKPRFQTRQS
jgi:hypothetical protein